jgi:hypothetical protein
VNNDAADFHLYIAQDAVSYAADYAEHICAPRAVAEEDRRTQLLAAFFRWHRCAKINLALAEFALLPVRPSRRTLKPLAVRRVDTRK